MNPKALALQQRTHAFFMNVIRLCETLPDNDVTFSIRPQLLDAAGSTDSNYRAACRGRSHAEFLAKLGTAAEEADESKGWLEALFDPNLGDRQTTRTLIDEADQLVSILVKSEKTAKKRRDAAATAKRQRR